ncbi:hypothetical protein PanWU01x14_181050 [Parasponia andersonii]|uniref:Transmembrane protein n=1 Tax=Parasponia andersonii TaxID=3476 RepID=A0A2P5C673_PARAD|nr:hypothetical protein PanWU01x14_181050 [Parasponia andersonii]
MAPLDCAMCLLLMLPCLATSRHQMTYKLQYQNLCHRPYYQSLIILVGFLLILVTHSNMYREVPLLISYFLYISFLIICVGKIFILHR